MKRPSEAPQKALHVLRAAVTTLESLGITTWLTDGTLLGAIRERAFIAHDKDMDLGAMLEQWTPQVDAALRAAGFTIRKKHGTPRRGLQHKLLKDDYRLDIFWHTDLPGGGVEHSAYDARGRITYTYDHLQLAKLKFLGHEFWAPHPARLHLVQKYGPAWRTPITDWDWADGPPNARREGSS